MHRFLTIVTGLLIGLNLSASTAHAQWFYPRGYGGYGMSQWGADPASGYMAGLGSYARGQGSYQLEKAKADAINVDTMAKWNKALRRAQRTLRQEKRKESAQRDADREARVEQYELKDGTTLNNLLLDILDTDPGAVTSGRARAPLSAAAIKEIPFEWDSEAISTCIDQLTGEGSLPDPLMAPAYAEERAALRAAVEPALKEDARGNVSPESRKKIDDAITNFRSKFKKNSSDFLPGYDTSLDYFTTLASLTRLLNDPSMKAFLAKVDEKDERTVGNLVAFMNSHNLRFGPATSDRQVEIYTRLVPILTAIRDDLKSAAVAPSTPDRSGEGLRSAAKEVFKGMTWDQLEAHAKGQ